MSAEKSSDGFMKLLVRKYTQSLKIKLPHVVFLVTNRGKELAAGERVGLISGKTLKWDFIFM